MRRLSTTALVREAEKLLQWGAANYGPRALGLSEDDIIEKKKAREEAVEKETRAIGLADFMREAWHVLEPGTVLVWNWHIDAIADHLEAVSNGQLRRLVINIPPGFMKSLSVSVFWPAWEWTQRPHKRFLTASYKQPLATRDAVKSRRVIQSAWYQAHWGHVFQLTGDQNEKTRYENDLTGVRVTTSVGSGTGERGDYRVLDDPHNADHIHSPTQRASDINWIKETWASRGNDPKTSASVVMMQRLHEGDATAYLVEEVGGYEHLMLPMRYEPARRCVTSIGFEDPRDDDDELLFPDRFNQEAVDEQAAELGPYGEAGQHQQDPKPRTGGVVDVDRLVVVEHAPAEGVVVRGWDLAATDEVENKTAAFTVGVRMRWWKGKFYVEHVERFRAGPHGVEEKMVETAELDGGSVEIDFPQDPGQAGKSQAQYLAGQLAGFIVHYSPESGDKARRLEAFASQVGAGNVYLVKGGWNKEYRDELQYFPNGRFKDQADATSRTFHRLLRKVRRTGGKKATGLATVPHPGRPGV